MGVAAEEYRDVGIYVKEPAKDPEPPQDVQQPQPERPPEPQRVEPDPEPRDVPEVAQPTDSTQPVDIDVQPPAEIDLPETDVSVIGAGPPPIPPGQPMDLVELVTPHSVRPAAGGAAAAGEGETTFIDIREKANRFCYIIDISGSMHGPPIRFARSQLKASLQQLSPRQEFQIIFYNRKVHEMKLPPPARRNGPMYRATSTNVSMAARFIGTVSPDFGTEHLRAIQAGLKMRPEVIFFLTDGTEPRLRGYELDQIRKSNAGTRIHCIEFGKGNELPVDNWVKRMANGNNGTYRYQDVSRLRSSL